MSHSLSVFLTNANFALTMAFTVEVVLKVFALGPGEFFSSSFNNFDLLIVGISLVETLASGGGGSGVTALRSLRTFRVFKSLRVLRVLKAFRCAERSEAGV